MAARWAHNPKVGGSSPPPATEEDHSENGPLFCDLSLCAKQFGGCFGSEEVRAVAFSFRSAVGTRSAVPEVRGRFLWRAACRGRAGVSYGCGTGVHRRPAVLTKCGTTGLRPVRPMRRLIQGGGCTGRIRRRSACRPSVPGFRESPEGSPFGPGKCRIRLHSLSYSVGGAVRNDYLHKFVIPIR